MSATAAATVRTTSLTTMVSIATFCALLRCEQADEPVDQKAQIEKDCHPACLKQWGEYEKCKERIAQKGSGSCEPWAFDYWKCVDKCVSIAAQDAPPTLSVALLSRYSLLTMASFVRLACDQFFI